MCGIVGAVANHPVIGMLLQGLKRLEYRGYDSAGVAIQETPSELMRLRTVGKVNELIQRCQQRPLHGTAGIAHTRWATHGEPNEGNAHPHTSAHQLAVVHNGIIENYIPLRQWLQQQGYAFDSDTDSEVAAHLIHHHYQYSKDLLQATQAAAGEMQGAFALGVIHGEHLNELVAIRRGSPLVVGSGDGNHYLASDPVALQGHATTITYLEENDAARLDSHGIALFDADGKAVTRQSHPMEQLALATDKGPYRHFMLKEIFEQPIAIADTLQGRFHGNTAYSASFGQAAPALLKRTRNIHIAACGTSYHAGMVAKYWLESLCGLPCQVEIASEYRYRDVVVPEGSLFVTVSQSGETADTLAALRKAQTMPYLTHLAICNVASSTLVREASLSFLTRAGIEIGVASTKAFTTQLVAFLLLTLATAHAQKLPIDNGDALIELPRLCEAMLQLDAKVQQLAHEIAECEHALFLGRGIHYPIAKEGALKLKEISYIHAEAYPAGELKHGPLALVDVDIPVVVVAPNNALLDKLKSNLEEVRARGGRLYVFADDAAEVDSTQGVTVIRVPQVPSLLSPIAYAIPLQLLAYHVAVCKGTDVDQPRNLAKSVTVE